MRFVVFLMLAIVFASPAVAQVYFPAGTNGHRTPEAQKAAEASKYQKTKSLGVSRREPMSSKRSISRAASRSGSAYDKGVAHPAVIIPP